MMTETEKLALIEKLNASTKAGDDLCDRMLKDMAEIKWHIAECIRLMEGKIAADAEKGKQS
jgi:hypothetical protein